MPPIVSFFLCTGLLCALVLALQRQKSKGRYKLPPGPAKLPLLGNLHQLSTDLHKCLWHLAQEHGPLMHLQLGSVPAIVISSPRLAKEVLKTHDLVFCSRPSMVCHNKLFYNSLDMAFTPYGEHWRHMRKLATLELFTTKRVQSFCSIRGGEVSQMMELISRLSMTKSAVNLSQILLSLANNVTCRAAFGKSYQVGDGSTSPFHDLLNETNALLLTFFAADYFSFGRWVDVITGKQSRLERNFLRVDGFHEAVIEDHLYPKSPKPEQQDFVDVMLGLLNESGLSKDGVKGALMNILVGGTDTSSATLVWAMTELMRNKRAMNKAQKEVRSLVGEKGRVEESDLNQLEYLKAVLKETFRLHPPVPLLVPHMSTQDCEIDGYKIVAKTRVYINAYAIGRDPHTWDKPEEFLPERFSNSSVDYKGNDFQLLPFGAGRRMCPGIYMGVVIAELALANLLYRYDWEVPPGMAEGEVLDLNECAGLIVHKKSPLLLVPTRYHSSIHDDKNTR